MGEEIYTLKRSARRTLALHVTPEGALEVRAPLRMPLDVIERFLAGHAGWTARQRARFAAAPKRLFAEGAGWPFRGTEYPIRVDGARAYGYFDEAFVLPAGYDLREQLVMLYRVLALRVLEPRARELARKFDIAVNHVRINDAKGRYGSCTGRGDINLAWRLVLWPDDVIDYVLVHELAHRLQMNHSAAFWREVELRCPDYRRREAFLRREKPKFTFLR